MSKARLSDYIRKNSVFIFAILVFLFLNPKFSRDVISDGSDKYYSRKKYNGLRDELDESNLSRKMPFFINTQFNRAERSRSRW